MNKKKFDVINYASSTKLLTEVNTKAVRMIDVLNKNNIKNDYFDDIFSLQASLPSSQTNLRGKYGRCLKELNFVTKNVGINTILV